MLGAFGLRNEAAWLGLRPAQRAAPLVDAGHVDGVLVSKAGRTAQFQHPRLSSFILTCLFHKGYLLFYA